MANDLPLADVNILDFTWVMAGPAATRVLADYGATVVRIESTRRLDTGRTIGPFHDGQPGVERSGFFHNVNAGKLGLTLDLSQEAGRAVALDLVRWAAVVTESFSPKAMRAWGLDYVALRQVKPDIIMLSTCLMGQSGPLAQFAGFGNLAAAISGFFSLTGWPDRPPAGPFGAYTDAARLAHHDALDALLATWTQEHDAHAAEAVLQAHGIPASAVQNSQELYNDPQLLHRGHFVQLLHALHGTTTVEGSRFKLSRTPARVERAGPTLGCDNQYVLETILGYSPERIVALTAAGVLQ